MYFRSAKLEDVEKFIEIITLSAPEFIYKLFGLKTEGLLRFLYGKTKNNFSHEYFQVLEIDNEVAGGILAYTKKQYQESELKTIVLILLKLNISLLSSLFTLLKAQNMIGSLTDGEMYISNLAVLPKYRGKGYGSIILSETEKLAKKHGCTKLSLDVDIDNKGAIRLYRGLGFTLEEDEILIFNVKDSKYQFYKMSKKL